MSVLIRNARPGDEKGIVYATMRGWQTAYNEILPVDYLATLDRQIPDRIQRWVTRLSDKEFCKRTFVVVRDEQLVGYITGGKSRVKELPHESEVYAMYVLKSHQREGLGHKLMNAMTEYFVEQKSNSMVVATLKQNFIARRFFETLSGKPVGEKTFEVQGVHYPEVIYGWEELEKVSKDFATRANSR